MIVKQSVTGSYFGLCGPSARTEHGFSSLSCRSSDSFVGESEGKCPACNQLLDHESQGDQAHGVLAAAYKMKIRSQKVSQELVQTWCDKPPLLAHLTAQQGQYVALANIRQRAR